MKKCLVSSMLVVAVLSITACNKENDSQDIIESRTLEFTSAKPILQDQTKTAWTGRTVQWSKGDAIKVAYTRDDVWQNGEGTATADETSGSKTAKIYQSTALAEDAATAQFKVSSSFQGTEAGTYKFYGAYPASACEGPNFKYAPSLTVTVPTSQTPAADSFDSAADIMIGQSISTYTGLPTEAVSMSWERMVAHAQITFNTLNGFTDGETIRSVVLTANSDADMVGQHFITLDEKAVTKPSSNTTANVLTINGDNLSVASGTFTAWASFMPCTVTSLKVVVTTNKATYTRDIATCSLDFKKDARNILAVNMAGADRNELEAQPDYSGEWLIGGLNDSNYYVAQKFASGNYNLKAVEISYDGSCVTYQDGIEDCKMVFTKVESGTYSGLYTIEDANSAATTKSYLYAASASKNYIKAQSTLDVNDYWSVTKGDDGLFTIQAEKSSNNNLMRFNYNNGSPIVSCYVSSTKAGTAITLIPYSAVTDTRTALSTPANIAAALATGSANSIDVVWDSVENAGSYVVTATPASGTAVSQTVSECSYTFTGLKYETTYTISVVAKPSDETKYKGSPVGFAYETVTTLANPVEQLPDPITLSSGTYSGSGNTGTIVWTGISCSITQSQGSSSATAVNSTYVSTPRWYTGNVISFKANSSYTITGAEIVCTTENYASALQNSTYSNDASAIASSTTVTITVDGDFTITLGGQSRISSIKVYYTTE